MELDLEEHDPSVLEYARYHGLSKDYALEPLPVNEPSSLMKWTFDTDLPGLDAPLTNPPSELIKEKLAVGKEAALLLKSVHSLQDTAGEEQLIYDGRKRIVGLKQELPLLATDNELDLLNFGSVAVPSFTDLKIPMEPINEEDDEGLEWPSKYAAYPTQCDMRAKGEKLAISKDALLYLQDAIKDCSVTEDSEEMTVEGPGYKRKKQIQPLTPPLLPLTPPLTPYIPSSPGNRLEPLSEDSNSTAAEAKALEKQIMKADALVRHDSNDSDPMLLDMTDIIRWSPELDDSNLPTVKRKAEGLKVEGPLTPLILSESPAKKLKSVTFCDMPQIIPDLVLPSYYDNGDEVLGPEDDFAGFYKELGLFAEEATKRIENEKLSEADTTKRVQVPDVSFKLPLAPWDQYKRNAGVGLAGETELAAQMKFLLQVKRIHMKSVESWHGLSTLDRDLPLAPFSTHVAKVSIEEKLHGEENLSKVLSELTLCDIVTSSTDVWKRDGLRILESIENEDDELEYAPLHEHKDMASLILKRKREIDDMSIHTQSQCVPKKQVSGTPQENMQSNRKAVASPHWKSGVRLSNNSSQPRLRTPSEKGRTLAPKETDRNLMFGGKFSAINALDNFMAIHRISVKPPAANEEKKALYNDPPGLRNGPSYRLVNQSHGNLQKDTQYEKQPGVLQVSPVLLPNPPAVPSNLPPCSFIFSSTLLQKRGLFKQIEALYPGADIVSRDFDLPYSVAKEADILISPSTGLLITTLQHVKQKALPGQPDRSPLEERVKLLQHRYERLVVVVSEGLSREMEAQGSGHPGDARDQEAISHFKDFAKQAEGDVLVTYVPGGEQALTRSIVTEMAMYGLPHGSKDIGDIKPLPDETNWEVFLRRAGLNPFAAQVILALLKDSIDVAPTSSSPNNSDTNAPRVSTFGLQTFLLMSAQQRVASFQAVLGGSRILKRINTLLDQEWISAAHGFRM